jgi:hypothetical protein
MPDFTKLAGYLDSFGKEDPNYDVACFIKAKIAEDLTDSGTVNNGDDTELADNDVTMSTPDQQSRDNHEGDMMSPAFKELDVLNKIEEEKDKVNVTESPFESLGKDQATPSDFGNLPLNQNMPQKSKKASLFETLQQRLKK